MTTIDLNFHFTDLDGKPQENQPKASKTLAAMLAGGSSNEYSRRMGWAMELHAKGKLDLEEASVAQLKAVVEQCQGLTDLAKYQLVNAIDAVCKKKE